MKKSKQCPKCDSLKVGIVQTLWPPLVGYVCGGCGYFEHQWKDLAELASRENVVWLNAATSDGVYR